MENQPTRPVRHRKGVLVLEVSKLRNFGEDLVEIIVSIPGHDSIVDARWGLRNGYLEPGTSLDMHAWVSSMINAALWADQGAQEVLPL